MIRVRAMFLSVFALALAVGGAQAQQPPKVAGEPVRPEFAAAKNTETWRAPQQAAAELRLQPLATARIESVKRHNADGDIKPLQIGIGRDITSEAEASSLSALAWQPVAGGQVARFDVVSPQAEGLRVALRADRLPDAVELRVAGSAMPDLVYAVTGAEARRLADGNGWYWTAVTDGDTQQLELFAPDGVDVATVSPAVASVSHLLVSMHRDPTMAKALGDSGPCNIDVVCRVNTLGQNFVVAKNAVARMAFQSGASTYTCTGTLLNDQDSSTQVPYFYTAHHCIGTQSEASTLVTFWNYETPTCNVDNPGPNTQHGGGAQMLYSQASTDGALLRLNNAPPSGVAFAGWDAGALNAGTQVTAIHHPSGDIKKVSRGTYSGTSANVNIGGQVITSSHRTTWAEGTTEGGSSGSGLFTSDANSYYLRGGLAGGSASCANTGQSEGQGNRDFYSRFDQVYPSIQQYLSGGGGPTQNYTGIWYMPTEAGWGLKLFQFPNVLFGVWFVYDSQGRASWLQLDPTWTSSNVASGPVLRWTGPPWGPTYNPNLRNSTQVGTFTLTFTSATQATFTYNVDGVNRTVTLSKI